MGIPRHEPHVERFSFAQPPPNQKSIVKGVQLFPLPHLKYIFSLRSLISAKEKPCFHLRVISTLQSDIPTRLLAEDGKPIACSQESDLDSHYPGNPSPPFPHYIRPLRRHNPRTLLQRPGLGDLLRKIHFSCPTAA